MLSFISREHYGTEDLFELTRLLRSPGGCPWDREQTRESIRGNLLEEACEVMDAIDKGDTELLREELGDLLLQVVFHCVLAEEEGLFSYAGVTDGVTRKLLERHPHVFGDVKAESGGEALSSWESVKRAKYGHETAADAMSAVPKTLPPLMRAEKVLKRAGKYGIDSGGEGVARAIRNLREAEDALNLEIDALIEEARR